MFTKPHAKNLRKGRYSETGRVYLVTTVTHDRKPFFLDLWKVRVLVKCLMFEEECGHAETLAFVVMPDHLHWLMRLKGDANLSKIVASVKSVSAHKIRRKIWQSDFHDHALRREEDLKSVARYIVGNPLRAALVKNIGDYPHWYAKWV